MTILRPMSANISQSSFKIGRRQSRLLLTLIMLSTIIALRMLSTLDSIDGPKFGENSNMNIHRLSAPLPMYRQKRQEADSQPVGQRKDCWRKCPAHRVNKLVYLHNKPDGLSDRLYILTNLLNLAGYICATVDVDKPSKMLATWHNQNQQAFTLITPTQYESGGKPTHSNFQWSDFFNFTLYNEDQKASITAASSNSQTSSIKLLREIPGPSSYAEENYKKSDAYGLKLVTDNPRDVFRHWKQIEKYSWQRTMIPPPVDHSSLNDLQPGQHGQIDRGGGFVWIINVNWYSLERVFYFLLRKNSALTESHNKSSNHGGRRMLEESSIGTIPPKSSLENMLPYPVSKLPSESACSYLREDIVPLRLRLFVDRIWEHAINNSSSPSSRRLVFQHLGTSSVIVQPIVGMLHIRRTDGQSECDTSLQRMESYITCSFQKSSLLYNNGHRHSRIEGGGVVVEVTMLFASDEKDQDYRDAVRTILLKHNSRIIGPQSKEIALVVANVVDIDKFVVQQVQNGIQRGDLPSYFDNNNYLIYRIEQILSSDYVSFNLKQRRTTHCHGCDPIQIQSVIS